MKINKIKELEEIKWKFMNLEVKIIKERMKKDLTEFEIKMFEKEIEEERKISEKNERMMRFKIEEIKELEIELKEVESEQTIKKNC